MITEDLDHCIDTGYFNEYKCEKENRIVLKPCASKSRILTKFYIFMASSIASAFIFGAFVHWRKSLLDQRVYTRLQNTFN